MPPGDNYVKFNVPASLRAAVPMIGGFMIDSNVTGAFGANTTNIVTLVSCTEECHVDAGYTRVSGFVSPTDSEIIMTVDEASIDARGSQLGTYNQLDWKYENTKVAHTTTSHFEISKSVDGEYIRIGQVLAEDSKESFRFEDYDVLRTGLYEYLIIQKDFNDETLSASTVSVDIVEVSVELLVFPNPVVDNMTIEVTNDKPADQMNIKICDGKESK